MDGYLSFLEVKVCCQHLGLATEKEEKQMLPPEELNQQNIEALLAESNLVKINSPQIAERR